MTGAFDWKALLRAGLQDLRLPPGVFWSLTPAELRLMLGVDQAVPPLSRGRLEELVASFPDSPKGEGNDRTE